MKKSDYIGWKDVFSFLSAGYEAKGILWLPDSDVCSTHLLIASDKFD